MVLQDTWRGMISRMKEATMYAQVTAFIRNNNVADRQTASWSAMENKKMKEICVIPNSAVVFHFAAVELWNC